MRYRIVLLLLLSGTTASNAGTLLETLRLAQNQTLAECVSNCIRTTFPVLRIAGYQEHALRNVQPRQRRAKTNAADSNSCCVSQFVRAARR
jgi:hypothetical protein